MQQILDSIWICMATDIDKRIFNCILWLSGIDLAFYSFHFHLLAIHFWRRRNKQKMKEVCSAFVFLFYLFAKNGKLTWIWLINFHRTISTEISSEMVFVHFWSLLLFKMEAMCEMKKPKSRKLNSRWFDYIISKFLISIFISLHNEKWREGKKRT